jgi:hypothetical protein
MDQKRNRHEALYRRTGRALFVLLGLWIAAMLLAWALPAKLWKSSVISLIFFDGIFPMLLLAAIVLGVLRIVSYIRWTGKYPYYFLFSNSHRSGNLADKGNEGAGSEKKGSARER